ncbi:MAG: sigma-54-dependent transcriptional regulator [Leptospirales bacterium]
MSIIQSNVLVVDDEHEMALALKESLTQDGFRVDLAQNGQEALNRVRLEGPYHWLISDLRMPEMDGWSLLASVKQISPETRVILMTAFGTVPQAVDAMRQGAVDFMMKPFSAEDLKKRLSRPVGSKSSSATLPAWEKISRPILTRDPVLVGILKMLEGVAQTPATVLIEGESGTGKELLARFIHERSPRSHRPFVAVNCAALPESLLESELFGYEKGAFSGALARKIGKFELAHTGTLLLDEIGEMELSLQSKLLRVIQEREVDRVGGVRPIPVDLRIIATTNRNMKEMVRKGEFREDLYYRLRVFPVTVPPLRKRPEDIAMLSRYFKEKLTQEKLCVGELTPGAMACLERAPFPGNIRELENVIVQASFLAGGGEIRPEHLLMLLDCGSEEVRSPGKIVPLVPGPAQTDDSSSAGVCLRAGQSVWEVERELIRVTLDACTGNRTQAAKLLGISVRTLRNKLNEYGMGIPEPDLAVEG